MKIPNVELFYLLQDRSGAQIEKLKSALEIKEDRFNFFFLHIEA